MTGWLIGLAAVLGLRHGGAPDHLAAVSTFIEKNQARGGTAVRYALRIGIGHVSGMAAVATAEMALTRWHPLEQTLTGWVGDMAAVWLVLAGLWVLGDLARRRWGPASRGLRGAGGRVDRLLRHRWAAYGVGLLLGLAVSPGDLAIFTMVATVASRPMLVALLLGTFWLAMLAALATLGFGLGLGGRVGGGRLEPWLAGASGLFGVGVGASLLLGVLH